MQIKGHFFEVTNMEAFAVSYLQNPDKPKTGTFKSAAGIRVQLGSVVSGFAAGFFPSLSLKTTTAGDGSFGFNISEAQLKALTITKMVFFVAYRQTGSVQVLGQNIPIFEPIYRSEAFDITKFTPTGNLELYFAPQNVPNSSGITQATVDSQIAAAKKKFSGIEKLGASIQNGKINVTGSGRGADIKFKIDLGVSTSSNLSTFIKGKVDDLDIDLPGPDFLVGLCVSKDDIAKEVDKGIAEVMKEANKIIEKALVDQVAAQTGQPAAIISALFKTTASLTFRSLTYPVVQIKTIKVPVVGDLKIEIRAIVPKLSIGFPRIIK